MPFLLIPLVFNPIRRLLVFTLMAGLLGVVINIFALSVNFLAVARHNNYYLNLDNPLEPMSYNIAHNPLPGHVSQFFHGIQELFSSGEVAKVPGEGLDFWWVFAHSESIPFEVIASILVLQSLPMFAGLAIFLILIKKGPGVESGELTEKLALPLEVVGV